VTTPHRATMRAIFVIGLGLQAEAVGRSRPAAVHPSFSIFDFFYIPRIGINFKNA
jgi:hypothetical protein